ncbi:hypothetical protein ACQJBY_009476 [Aegilops geniculata]
MWAAVAKSLCCTAANSVGCVQPLSDFGGMLWLQNYALPTYRWKGKAHQGMPYYGKNEALLKIVYYYLSSMWGDQPKEESGASKLQFVHNDLTFSIYVLEFQKVNNTQCIAFHDLPWSILMDDLLTHFNSVPRYYFLWHCVL